MGDTDDMAAAETPAGDQAERPHWLSAAVVRHACQPQRLGRIEGADAYGAVCGWCGEVMEIYLRLDGDRIAQATFWADGCISTMACGDMLAMLVEGKTLSEAGRITPRDVVIALGGLPHSSVHCSELAVSALRQALEQAEHEGS